VDSDCKVIQEALAELGGDVSRCGEGQQQHLESCPSCHAVAAAESGLSRILREAVPPAEPQLVDAVMRALEPANGRRRLVALLPVAASLVMTLLGVAMMGGVPGGSLVARLPLWSANGWLSLATAAGDWVVALTAASQAARIALPTAVPTTAFVISLLGLALVVTATRRWRTVSPWRRHG